MYILWSIDYDDDIIRNIEFTWFVYSVIDNIDDKNLPWDLWMKTNCVTNSIYLLKRICYV